MKRKIAAGVLFIITLTGFLIIENQLKTNTGITTILDKMLYYNEVDVEQMFKALGESGRRTYRYLHIIDYVFILSFALVQILLMKDRLAKIKPHKTLNTTLFLLPIVVRGILDSGENILIGIMLKKYPVINVSLVTAGYAVSLLKWIFLAVIIGQIIYTGILSKKLKKAELHRLESSSTA
jgi:hypothetical protein